MARFFAEIGADQEVLRVVVCDDIAWLQSRLGGTWVETFQNDPAELFAGKGWHDSETIAEQRYLIDWIQPIGSENSYPMSAWVWHNGRAWRSLQDANVFEPGIASWREMLTEWPEWVQPTGAQDAYQIGEKITYNGNRYINNLAANVWNPDTLPTSWDLQP